MNEKVLALAFMSAQRPTPKPRLTMTRWRLVELIFKMGVAELSLADGTPVILQSITRESGCGTSFIAKVLVVKPQRYDEYMDVLIKVVD